MARPYSPRPLTTGVVTIWYRAPELLLATKNYTLSVDLWSAGLVLAELLHGTPLLTGENPVEQLSLIAKLLGSPTSDDLAALAAMGCPELVNWRKEALGSGRADNMERRFHAQTSETINFLRGLLTWSPQTRWTASEALGKGKSFYSAAAEKWWHESPRAADKEFLPTYPEIRNGEAVGGIERRSRKIDVQESQSGKEAMDDYVFDFDGRNPSMPTKRPRPH
jgi:cyclin-dependent kinase 10